tara:strand:+ start:908 stop:1243 length:336 start_codon:yes stop_codon:yes gene_type:complete
MIVALFAALLIQSNQPTFGEMEFLPAQVRDRYIHGALAAWLWANADLEHQGLQPLYCTPLKLGLTTDQADSIAQQFANEPRNAVRRDDDYAMILMLALKDTFPCPSPAAAP